MAGGAQFAAHIQFEDTGNTVIETTNYCIITGLEFSLSTLVVGATLPINTLVSIQDGSNVALYVRAIVIAAQDSIISTCISNLRLVASNAGLKIVFTRQGGVANQFVFDGNIFYERST